MCTYSHHILDADFFSSESPSQPIPKLGQPVGGGKIFGAYRGNSTESDQRIDCFTAELLRRILRRLFLFVKGELVLRFGLRAAELCLLLVVQFGLGFYQLPDVLGPVRTCTGGRAVPVGVDDVDVGVGGLRRSGDVGKVTEP